MILNVAVYHGLRYLSQPKTWILATVQWLFLAACFSYFLQEYLIVQQSTLSGHTITQSGITAEVLHPFFGWMAMSFLIMTPLLNNFSLASERQNDSLYLYVTSPMSSASIVLGFFLSLLGVNTLLFLSGISLLFPLLTLVQVDVPLLLSQILGTYLVIITSVAITSAASVFSSTVNLASLMSLALTATLAFFGWARIDHDLLNTFGMHFSLLDHYQNLLVGIINVQDFAYFSLIPLTAIALSVLRLNWERY